ncbi:hypothetical protein [Nocardiopsis coralliicola]
MSNCCSSNGSDRGGNGGRPHLPGGDADEMATCPVMAGTPVRKAAAEAAGLFRDYAGRRYYLCCADCGPAFDADPAAYAAGAV